MMDLTQFDGHTPGPWQCILSNPLAHGDVVTFEGEVVARIRGWGWLQKLPDGAVQQDANGRLVAASPDLLAEVRRLTAEAADLRRERDELRTQVHIITSERDELADCVQSLRARHAELAARLEAIERAEPVAWIEHELQGTGLRHLHFERRPNTLRDDVVAPVWTALIARPACDWPGKCAHKRPAQAAAPERAAPTDGCGACGDACRSRGSCRLADESPRT